MLRFAFFFAVMTSLPLVAQDNKTWVVSEPVAGSDSPLQLTFVPTRDGIYTPIALRKPPGDGPFPAVLFLAGNGGGGMAAARNAMLNRGYASDRFLSEGYVVAWLRYRAEIRRAYESAQPLPKEGRVLPRSPLDHDDLIAIVGYIGRLPFVDRARVGLVGSSHGGEMILKAASEIGIGSGVLCEPAAHEFLSVAMDQLPPGEPQLQDIRRVRQLADERRAMERVRKIRSPLLVIGRDGDHLQGVFRLTYEWLRQAGKDVEWVSYDHPRHGFALPRRGSEGKYQPNEAQENVIAKMLEFFKANM